MSSVGVRSATSQSYTEDRCGVHPSDAPGRLSTRRATAILSTHYSLLGLVFPPRDALEARVLLVEEQRHDADRPVALLADDDLGLPLDRGVLELAVLALGV